MKLALCQWPTSLRRVTIVNFRPRQLCGGEFCDRFAHRCKYFKQKARRPEFSRRAQRRGSEKERERAVSFVGIQDCCCLVPVNACLCVQVVQEYSRFRFINWWAYKKAAVWEVKHCLLLSLSRGVASPAAVELRLGLLRPGLARSQTYAWPTTQSGAGHRENQPGRKEGTACLLRLCSLNFGCFRFLRPAAMCVLPVTWGCVAWLLHCMKVLFSYRSTRADWKRAMKCVLGK